MFRLHLFVSIWTMLYVCLFVLHILRDDSDLTQGLFVTADPAVRVPFLLGTLFQAG